MLNESSIHTIVLLDNKVLLQHTNKTREHEWLYNGPYETTEVFTNVTIAWMPGGLGHLGTWGS